MKTTPTLPKCAVRACPNQADPRWHARDVNDRRVMICDGHEALPKPGEVSLCPPAVRGTDPSETICTWPIDGRTPLYQVLPCNRTDCPHCRPQAPKPAEAALHPPASYSFVRASPASTAWAGVDTDRTSGSPPPELRGAHCFEAREDGSLIIWATMPDEDGEPIRIEPNRVTAVLRACGAALAKKPSRY